MLSICEADCCDKCGRRAECGGCTETDGHPFGGKCFAAEYIKKSGTKEFLNFKKSLIDEFNSLGIKGLEIKDLNLLNGFYINLEYKLANGQSIKLLEDNKVYLGNQIEKPEGNRCYGIAADDKYLLVCEYGFNGADPEIIIYKKR